MSAEQPFTFLRITAETDCTFRCKKCNPEGAHDPRMMPTPEVIDVARAAVSLGIKTSHLLGGEPSMRKDIVPLVAGMRAAGMETVEMTTNGVPFYRLVRELREAGLTGVNISLDTLNPDVFQQLTGRNALRFTLQAIEEARRWYDRVAINAVVLKDTLGEVPAFLAFAKRMGVMVRFCELTPDGPFMAVDPGFFDRQHVPREAIVRSLEEVGPILPANKLGIDRQNAHSEYVTLGGAYGGMTVGLITQYSNGWPCPKEGCRRLRIGPTSANSCIAYPDRNLLGLSYDEKRGVLQSLFDERRMQMETGAFPAQHDPSDSYPLYRFGLRQEERVAP